MTFKIERVSDPHGDKQPCEAAYSATERKECRAKIGHMACDCGSPECHGAKPAPPRNWYIVIDSLEQLLKLVNSEGKLVISKSEGVTFFEVEIYDTYRE